MARLSQLDQWRVRPYANKINHCLVFLHALPFSRAYLVGRARVLATTCLPPLLPAACEHVRRPRERKRVPYRRPGAMGADVGGVSLAARHGQCGQAQKANSIRAEAEASYLN